MKCERRVCTGGLGNASRGSREGVKTGGARNARPRTTIGKRVLGARVAAKWSSGEGGVGVRAGRTRGAEVCGEGISLVQDVLKGNSLEVKERGGISLSIGKGPSEGMLARGDREGQKSPVENVGSGTGVGDSGIDQKLEGCVLVWFVKLYIERHTSCLDEIDLLGS